MKSDFSLEKYLNKPFYLVVVVIVQSSSLVKSTRICASHGDSIEWLHIHLQVSSKQIEGIQYKKETSFFPFKQINLR